MSRIFDALQRVGVEQTGVEYADMVSVATEVFETPHRPVSSPSAENPAPAFDVPALVSPSTKSPALPGTAAMEFPALDVSVPRSSRLVYFSEPDSLAAEKFRFLGVRLRQLRQNRPLKKVLVTSTIPEEGKSLVSANLAGVLAQRKEKVLLIEGDMRRPTLAQELGLGRLTGLAEWLQNGVQTSSNIYHLTTPGFWFMPAGDPPSNPLELMQSGRLSTLMGSLTTLFDWIIVDSPPLLPLADTTVWARMTDGALLVAREGKTEKAPLLRGLDILKKSDLLGVVLNGCSQLDLKNYYQRYAPAGRKSEAKK